MRQLKVLLCHLAVRVKCGICKAQIGRELASGFPGVSIVLKFWELLTRHLLEA